MYECDGTCTDVTTCGICGARGLEETVVLLAHTVDGEIGGNMYACESCADQAPLPRRASAVAAVTGTTRGCAVAGSAPTQRTALNGRSTAGLASGAERPQQTRSAVALVHM